MSYSLSGWDQLIPQSEGAGPQTYRYTVAAVRNLPPGAASEVSERVGLFLRNAGFEYWDVRWGRGGTLVLQYRSVRDSPAWRSGVERRRAVEGALASAARSLGPNVRFGASVDPESSSDGSVRRVWPWILGGAAVLLALTVVSGVGFDAGAGAAGGQLRPVRANRRSRR